MTQKSNKVWVVLLVVVGIIFGVVVLLNNRTLKPSDSTSKLTSTTTKPPDYTPDYSTNEETYTTTNGPKGNKTTSSQPKPKQTPQEIQTEIKELKRQNYSSRKIIQNTRHYSRNIYSQ